MRYCFENIVGVVEATQNEPMNRHLESLVTVRKLAAARVFGLVLLAATHGLACAGEAPTLATDPSGAPVPETELLLKMKSIADGGSLLQPDQTAEILGIPFSKIASIQQQPMPLCTSPATGRSIETTIMDPPASWWYRAQTSAPGKLPIPAAFINPASTSAEPSFHYEIRHVVECTDRFGLQDTTEAKLSFNGLPSFACLSPGQILAAIPGAANELATDGVSFVAYPGHVDDESGTSLRFFYRMGVRCALSASIEQSQKTGLRALRARSTSSACRIAANRHWCAANGPVGWADGAALDRMDLDADHVCGTEDSIYRKEPASGDKPGPVAQRKLGGVPCDLP